MTCTNDDELSVRAVALAPRVASNLEAVRARIEGAGGDRHRVSVLAVTKGFGAEAALAATMAGLGAVGENYAEELREKATVLAGRGPSEWHFIGRIQRNKVGRLAGLVSCWQSVARAADAEAIARRAETAPSAFVEVNLSGDRGRPGCSLEEAPVVVEAVRRTGLFCRGLMAIAPLGLSGADLEETFSSLGSLSAGLGLAELSIGMSEDLEAAVRAGSTMVRVGRALFGPRIERAGGRVLQE